LFVLLPGLTGGVLFCCFVATVGLQVNIAAEGTPSEAGVLLD